jgi:hypothetical protein
VRKSLDTTRTDPVAECAVYLKLESPAGYARHALDDDKRIVHRTLSGYPLQHKATKIIGERYTGDGEGSGAGARRAKEGNR